MKYSNLFLFALFITIIDLTIQEKCAECSETATYRTRVKRAWFPHENGFFGPFRNQFSPFGPFGNRFHPSRFGNRFGPFGRFGGPFNHRRFGPFGGRDFDMFGGGRHGRHFDMFGGGGGFGPFGGNRGFGFGPGAFFGRK